MREQRRRRTTKAGRTPSGAKILCVGEEGFVDVVLQTLTDASYAIQAAHCGADALLVVTRECPDAILLDAAVADIDGAMLCGYFGIGMNIPVVVAIEHAAYADNGHHFPGTAGCVTKPLNLKILIMCLKDALEAAAAGKLQANVLPYE